MVSVIVPVSPSLVAAITAVPLRIPLTTPAALTAAIAESELDQETSRVWRATPSESLGFAVKPISSATGRDEKGDETSRLETGFFDRSSSGRHADNTPTSV